MGSSGDISNLASSSYRNELLRAHVTRVGFDLTLGWTQIEAIVRVAEAHRTQKDVFTNMRYWIAAVRGCIDRGLVVYKYAGGGKPLHKHYKLTRAGEMVIGLLRESGLYEEYARPSVELVKSA